MAKKDLKLSNLRQNDRVIIQKQKDEGTLYDTKQRASIIIPQWLDKKIGVYNGKIFVPVKISATMIGHKLGEYSWTKKPATYITKSKKTSQNSKTAKS